MRKEVIEIQVKGTGEAISKTKELEKSINNVKTETKSASEATSGLTSKLDQMTGGAISKFKGMVNSIKSVNMGFNAMKVAIIGTGIGALILAVVALQKAFTSSEEGQNKFAKIMGVIGALAGNLVDLLADLGEKIIWVFENPKKAINDFVKLLKENIINRFEGLLELIPKIGESINLLFKGEFVEAGKVAGNAIAKVTLGVEDFTDKVNDAIEAVKEFSAEQVKEAKLAAQVADMRAKADKIERDLIVERSKLESKIALLRLKSRQEDEFGAEERKQALIEAQALEDQLLDKQTEFLELRRDAIQLENTFSRTDKENKLKEAQAIAAVNNQIASRANTARQLQRELNTIQGQIDAENKAAETKKLEEQKIKDEAEKKRLADIYAYQKEIKKAQEDEEAVTELEKFELEKARAIEKLDFLNATEEQRANIIAYWDEKIQKQKEEDAENEKKINELVADAKVDIAYRTLGLIGSIAKQGSTIGKTVAVAQATISGIQGVQNAYTTAQKSPITALFPAYPAIQAGLAGAFSAVQIGKILSVKQNSGSAGLNTVRSSGGTSVQTPTPAIQQPSFNIVGQSQTNQLADSISAQEKAPLKAYVVASDVSTAQSLDRNIIESASL
jgi:hypothetical protein